MSGPVRDRPVLVGCSHGTSDPAGRAAIRALLDDVRARRPELDVREAFVDVQQPEVADVVTEVVGSGPDGGRDAVVVPLLLSAGFHVDVDVAAAVAPRGPGAGRAVAAAPLGPDDRLLAVVLERLRAVGTRDEDAVVVAAAGSSRPQAARDVDRVVAGLRATRSGPVAVGYGAMATPSVTDAVAAMRASGRRVVVVAFLLAPGFFHDRLREAGGDVVTAPLLPEARIAEIVLDRYDRAVLMLAAVSTPAARPRR